LPEALLMDEKRLLRWYRQCNEDRQAILLSSAEVLAEMTLQEKKAKAETETAPLENHKIA